MGSDERMMSRVMLVAGGALVSHFGWTIGANFALGVAIGLGSFALLHRAVMTMGGKPKDGQKQSLTGVALLQIGKFLVLGVAFYLLFASGKANAPALAAGVTLPTGVLCLTEAGRRVNQAVGNKGPTTPGDEPSNATVDSKQELD